MKTFVRIEYETKWEQAELSYPEFRYIRTIAMPKNYSKAIDRARKFADTLIVNESDGKPFTRKLKEIKIVNK